MSLIVNDNPHLVAPRPVRVTPAYPHVARSAHLRLANVSLDTDHLVIQEDNENIEERNLPPRIPSTDKEPCSSRASPLYVSCLFRISSWVCQVHCGPTRSDRCSCIYLIDSTDLLVPACHPRLSRSFCPSCVPPYFHPPLRFCVLVAMVRSRCPPLAYRSGLGQSST